MSRGFLAIVLGGMAFAGIAGCQGSDGQQLGTGGANGGGAGSGSGGAASGGAGLGSGGAASGGAGSGSGGAASGGAGLGSGGAASGGASGTAVAFTMVQAIFDQFCTDCHLAAAVGLPGGAPMALTKDASYAALVGKAATATCGGTRVVAGSSSTSFLVRKLVDAKPCAGERMPRPLEGGPSTPLDAARVDTIRRWIDSGAPR